MLDYIGNFFNGKKKETQNGSSDQVNQPPLLSLESTSSLTPDAALPMNEVKENPTQVNVNTESVSNKLQHIIDCETMTAKQLKLTYLHEHASWRGRKNWAKKHKVRFSSDFDCFRNFLAHHGPKPDKSWTLDRIDNSMGYVPGNTRWANKTTQAENRKNVTRFKVAGEEIPQPALAHALDMSPDALRKRLANGHSLLDIIAKRAGSNNHGQPKPTEPLYKWPWPKDCENELEAAYQHHRQPQEHRHHFFVRYCGIRLEELRNADNPLRNLTQDEIQEASFWRDMKKLALSTRERAIREYRAMNNFHPSTEFLRRINAFSGTPSNTTDEELRTD